MIQPTNMQSPYPATGGANAVAINIFNPQAYGNMPQQTMPMTAPYAYQNPLYNMPNASAYNMNAQNPMAYQQFIPMQQPVMMPYQQVAPMEQPMATAEQQFIPMQQPIAPAPQAMPQSVMEAPVIAPVVAQAIDTPSTEQKTEQTAPEVQATIQQPVEIVESQPAAPVVDIDGLVQNLKSADNNVKAQTINEIATYAQESPEIALQVVSEPVMQSLVDIIKEDTTGLEGPNAQQIAVAEKIAKGEQLTQEENTLAEQLSPRDMANKNRIFALYTLAMIQKLQRDELNQYIETQKANGQETIAPLGAQDLVGYNDVVNVIQNDSRPEVKVAAIQALQHILEPQDKATVEPILAQAQASTDNAVKEAATEAMAKFQQV